MYSNIQYIRTISDSCVVSFQIPIETVLSSPRCPAHSWSPIMAVNLSVLKGTPIRILMVMIHCMSEICVVSVNYRNSLLTNIFMCNIIVIIFNILLTQISLIYTRSLELPISVTFNRNIMDTETIVLFDTGIICVDPLDTCKKPI